VKISEQARGVVTSAFRSTQGNKAAATTDSRKRVPPPVNGERLPGTTKEMGRKEMLLRESEARSRQIVDASPLAMLVSRAPEQIVEAINDKFTKLFGYTMEDMPDAEHWWPLAYPDEETRERIKSEWTTRISAALRYMREIEPMEARVCCKDGSCKDIEFHISTLGDRFLVSFVDLTARKSAEEALRISEERFRLAAEAGRMYAYEWDRASGRVVRSAECKKLLGEESPLVASMNEIAATVRPEDVAQMGSVIGALTPKNSTGRAVFRAQKTDGTEIWLEQSFRGYFDGEGNLTGLVGMVADITGRKEAEDTLKALSGRLIEAQEQERRRIARDLHDDINQRLAILNIELQQLAENPPESQNQLKRKIKELEAKASEISTEVSAITHELHSPKLELLGIVAAMKGFCEEMETHHNIAVDFRSSGVSRDLPRNISLCLFRIFQEAVRNAAKHSGVDRIKAELAGTANEIILIVSDCGKGFRLDEAQSSRGLGLVSMRERVSLVNGTISIESQLRAGTTIQVRIPLNG
jgi:PAS domain S-box-containing protein